MFKRDENFNIALGSDSYKFSHAKQLEPGAEHIFSYFESRGGEYASTIFFGLQYLLKRYVEGQVVTKEKIDAAEAIVDLHMGKGIFNRVGWEHILTQHGGRLPVKIQAVKEGTEVPTHNVLMTIENTDPAVPWLTNFLETLLVQVWYPTTVCTRSHYIKNLIRYYLERTGDPMLLPFKFHDFGYRGSTSQESAALGGAAHLVNFQGTDTLAGLMLAKEYYDAGVCGFSIPAAEHSTITSWGQEHEVDAFRNMLEQFPTGLVAVVSDSFDIYHACRELWGKQLRDKVLARNGTIVVRPDSGEPTTVVCKVLDLLGDAFGYTKNAKGYKVLDPHVRVIQGDGIDLEMTRDILTSMRAKEWSADNIAFGCGGALLQKLNRDTLKFAFKASSVVVNGQERDVWKQPITDSGKNSKRGRLKLIRKGNDFTTVRQSEPGENQLVEVFRDGVIIRDYAFQEIRARAEG